MKSIEIENAEGCNFGVRLNRYIFRKDIKWTYLYHGHTDFLDNFSLLIRTYEFTFED